MLSKPIKSNAVAIRRLFLFRLGGQREHHSDDTIENDSTESSSSESETDNTEATDTEPELSDDSKCELDGISSLFDERSGSDLSADDESDDDDDRGFARSELNSKNDNTERTDENTEATELSDSICQTIFFANLMASRRCLMNTGVLNWVTMINAAISMEGMMENLWTVKTPMRSSIVSCKVM